MSDRVNRRDLILKTAAQLFIEKGYHATSMRQIADVVGCTEAALYYHFKDGKRALFQAALELHAPDLLHVMENSGRDATSLGALIDRLGQSMASGDLQPELFRWVMAELPHLSDEEVSLIRQKQINAHRKLSGLVERFIRDETQAALIAWLLMSAAMGYIYLFQNVGLETCVDFSIRDLVGAFVALLEGKE